MRAISFFVSHRTSRISCALDTTSYSSRPSTFCFHGQRLAISAFILNLRLFVYNYKRWIITRYFLVSNEIRVPTMKLNQQWAGNSWFPSAVYSVTPTTLLLSLSHPRLLRRQSSRIESKIQKLGRRVGHTLFGVNESCRASESEHPPPLKFVPGGTLARPQWPSFLCLLSQWGREPACPTRNAGPRTFPRVFIFVFSWVSEERGQQFI